MHFDQRRFGTTPGRAYSRTDARRAAPAHDNVGVLNDGQVAAGFADFAGFGISPGTFSNPRR